MFWRYRHRATTTLDIGSILNNPCIFWPEKRVRETHLLVLIPNTVNEKPLTLNLLQQLIQHPQGEGHATNYSYYNEHVLREIGDQSVPSSYWVLVTKDVLPNSQYKLYSEQQALIKPSYTVPKAIEIATSVLMHYAETGERLYGDSPHTYTRCQEMLNNGSRMVVGSFVPFGLYVHCYYDVSRRDDHGLGAVRKF